MEEQRLSAIQLYEEGSSVSEAAETFGVSRKTIYKWLERYTESGLEGLSDQSRRPHNSPTRVTAEAEADIVEARLRWKWGPRKLRVKLCEQDSERDWPAVSTIAAVLRAKGLAISRRRRARSPVQRSPYAVAGAPNVVWCGDFKGWFRVGDGTRVDPLTITDAYSRFLLRSQIVDRADRKHVQGVYEGAFLEYGLPDLMHHDNGPPFGSVAPGGLSRLAMWLIRLGIAPEYSRPGCPQDNGSHERMHLTLKQATAMPPQRTVRLQQKAFDEFRTEFNEQRPHQGLDDCTPQSRYVAGNRVYPRRLPELVYGDEFEVRRISQQGSLKWKGERTFISEIFGRETVGLKAADERWMKIYYGPVQLGWFDSYRHRFRRKEPRELRVRAEEPERVSTLSGFPDEA
jgi:putative transposase